MAKTVAIVAVLSFVIFGGAAGFLMVAHSEPSTQALDADLADIRTQIKSVDHENAKYAGGAIKSLILLRREILQTAEAMLKVKRASLIRRIDLQFIVDGERVAPASHEKLSEMEDDIRKENTKLSEDVATASQYSGGLLRAMSLMTAATDRLALAELQLGYYGAKYGTRLPIAALPTSPTPRGPPGKIVGDKQAF